MAASIRLLGHQTYQYLNLLTKTFNCGLNCCTQARNIYLCHRNVIFDQIGCLSANQYTLKKDFTNLRQFCSGRSNNSDHVVTTSPSTSDNINQVVDKSENINEEQEEDCLYSKIIIEVKGHDPSVINSYEKFVSMTAEGLGVEINNIFTPPKVITRYTLLKSVHIFKKHRVQYENRTHYRVIEFMHLTGSTADTILEYIQRNLPEGMAMKVTRHRIEKLPQHLQIAIKQ